MEIRESKGQICLCSECDAEVSQSDLVCPYCNADLKEVLETYGEVAIVKVYPGDFEAQSAKAQLDDAGIKCFISTDNEGGMMPSLSLSIGVRLIVNKVDLEKAVEILKVMNMY